MSPDELIAIIKAFFDAVLRVLRALGFIKPAQPEEPTSENASA